MKEPLAGLRHSARGCLNAVKLCVAALELECTFDEQIEFIDDIIRGSDKMCTFIDELAAYFESNPVTQSIQNA